MSLKAIALLFVVGALVAGCLPTQVREDATGHWTQIPPGSTLKLNRPVQVPQDRARIFFLSGQVRPSGANIGPSCGLEVRVMSRDGDQTIEPQTFEITRVQDLWTEVARLQPPRPVHFQLAQSTDGASGGSPLIQVGYHLWLKGPDRNVLRLTCLGMLDDMWKARAITLTEIRAALGTVATLSIAANP
jgi:hypothetical protein